MAASACLFACVAVGINYITRVYTLSSSILGAFHRQLKFHRIKLPHWLYAIKIFHLITTFSTHRLRILSWLYFLPPQSIYNSIEGHICKCKCQMSLHKKLIHETNASTNSSTVRSTRENNPVNRRNCVFSISNTSVGLSTSIFYSHFLFNHTRPPYQTAFHSHLHCNKSDNYFN